MSRSPSSSAVTIPNPGKSILKRPPPSQQSLFSRITRFLPTQASSPPPASQTTDDVGKPLKRAHFILPQIATVYPISSINPPSTPTLKEEKKAIEEREAERRKRVVRGNSVGTPGEDTTEEWWNLDKVESFYRECCEGTEEHPDPAVTLAFKSASGSNPRSVDLSGVQITPASSSILSDVFTIEWGLRKLVLRECDLDEFTLKPILHALLIPGTLSFLSVSSNRRLKAPAFRLLGAYVAKAESLQFLDLSQIPLDKKSVEYIVAALPTAPTPGLVSLRLDDCSLRPAALEALSRAVRTSSLRNISLRHNRITATGAVPLALMIRDYPDVVPASSPSPPSSAVSSASSTLSPTAYSNHSPSPSMPGSPASSILSLPVSPLSPPGTPTKSTIHGLPPLGNTGPAGTPRAGPIMPPPRHPPPGTGVQTTYTPYVPRSRRAHVQPLPLSPNPLSASGQPVPIITSSSQGGVTMRHPTQAGHGDGMNGSAAVNGSAGTQGSKHAHALGPSAALLDKVRALDALPRLGALRTLDLRGNDLRGGITYLAQVLKRNRTLKVLNLSENKLDVTCLVAVAEALKYNLSLETLDLSKNPCSGPGLEGIQSLRTAFTLNTALKRLFLSSTSMTSAGAIALAEFLPESTSLLHLDLTLNQLDIAGVMALSVGLKANHVMRCLDVNIPPGDEEFARMCRDILNSCVRNTEEAEKASQTPTGQSSSSGRGFGKGVWGMIEESELAKSIRQGEENQVETDIVTRARVCVSRLSGLTSPSPSPASTISFSSLSPTSPGPDAAAVKQGKDLLEELNVAIQSTTDPTHLEVLLNLNDELTEILAKAPPPPGRPALTLQGLGFKWEGADAISISPGLNSAGSMQNGNGQLLHESPVEHRGAEPEDEEPEPTTPRIDKGKGRAEPEPEPVEKVLSPTFLISESESEDEEGPRFPLEGAEEIGSPSPTDRSRIWVAEEGEVFRKGNVLLGPEEMEGEYAGEDLRRELLEAMVERPPPRPIVDEFGIEVETIPEQEQASPVPSSPSLASPQESKKPPPRPYVSRTRSSSSSTITPASPTLSPRIASPLQSDVGVASPRSPIPPVSPNILSGARPFTIRGRSTETS